MPDIPISTALMQTIESWLLPVSADEPCGPDLELDAQSLELREAMGKPDSQFGPGVPPNWSLVCEVAERLFERTRDLRVALWWSRGKLNLVGLPALPAVLALFGGLLDRFWDGLHPLADADDSEELARLSVLGGFDKRDNLLGDVRIAKLSADAPLNGLRVRDVELSLAKLAPRADETVRTQAQIIGLFGEAAGATGVLNDDTDAALALLGKLQNLIHARYGADKGVDLVALRGMLTSVKSILPDRVEVAALVPTDPSAGPGAWTPPPRASGISGVESRQEAIRAIELVCTYLERNEPTNPAQLLLRRAARVIDKNFLQLVQELAPDAVKDVARIMGVDPKEGSEDN